MKRLLLALLVLASFCASAEMHVFDTGDGAMILDDKYELVSLGEYEMVMPLDGFELYAAKTPEGWTVLNAQAVRIGSGYQKLCACPAGIIAMREQKYQLLDAELQPKSTRQYMLIKPLGEGALALKGQSWDSIPDRVYYLDGEGKEAIRDIRLIFTGEEKEGLIPACDGETGVWGVIGQDAYWQTAPAFASVGSFVNGIAPASMISGMGVINTQGEWLLHPLFTDVRVNESLVMCRELGAVYVYRRDENGLILISAFERADGELLEDYYAVRAEGMTEIYDSYGTMMLSCEGNMPVYQGLSAQIIDERNGQFEVVDIEQNKASEQYDMLRTSGGSQTYLCGTLTEDGLKFGLLDRGFTTVLPSNFDWISVNAEGLAAAGNGARIEVYSIMDGTAALLNIIDKE
ncbi:MAG: hypothetical protein K5663_01870 [Clostridiales bacterium]|nr:hypothetical protein [Clostridiales bacterium]